MPTTNENIRNCLEYRENGVDLTNSKVLISEISSSVQAFDLRVPPNCNGYGRIHHFKRYIDGWGENPLPIDPACNFLGLKSSCELKVQIFQAAFCCWRCWYCFVDPKLLCGSRQSSRFFSTSELFDLYLKEDEKCCVIVLSGGQPDIVPEWTLWFIRTLESRGYSNKLYLWSDDNLSNDFLKRFLTKVELKEIARYRGYGRVGCFKGFDDYSFSFNTNSDKKYFKDQFKFMKALIDCGIDTYGYITLTTDDDRSLYSKIKNFVDILQNKIHENFPLRIVPLKIFTFTPTRSRLNKGLLRALEIQHEAKRTWDSILSSLYNDCLLNTPIHKVQIL